MALYRIRPHGLNSTDVESFASYLARLAIAHGTTLPTLLNHTRELDRKDGNSFLAAAKTNAKPDRFPYFGKPTQSVSDLVDLIEKETGQKDLRCTTLLALQNLAWRSANFNHKDLHWCPLCWKEDIHCLGEVYLRLIWVFGDVTRCHRHGVLLQSRCAKCGDTLQLGHVREDLSKCTSCGCSLLLPGVQSTSIKPGWSSSYSDLLKLVSACSKDSSLFYREDRIRHLLLAIVSSSIEIDFEEKFWMEFCSLKGDWKHVIQGRRISFVQLRRMAHRLGISFTGLLDGNPESWTAQLNPQWSWNLPSQITAARRVKKSDYASCEKDVREYLNNLPKAVSPPLRQVAQELGLSVGGMEYNFPEMCEAIKSNYRKWLEKRRALQKWQAEVKVKAYMADPNNSRSKKKAVAILMKNHDLPKNLLRDVLRNY